MTPDNQKIIKKIKKRANQILEKKDVEKILKEIKYLEKESTSPNFWNNNEEAQKKMQKLGDLKSEIESINHLRNRIEDIETLEELDEEGEDIEKEIKREIDKTEDILKEVELEMFLSGKYDVYSAVFTIYAGQGGTEACDWADMLLRMYLRYFENKNWKVFITDKIPGDEVGIKSVSMEVHGRFAYGFLKKEHGTHRLVRVSPFNAQGLRQTSFAGVEVEPLIEEDIDIDIKDEDIEFKAVRASGPGGQSVNKTSSAVQITHKPTNIQVTASSQKSQLQNRKAAMNRLRAKLLKREEEKIEKAINKETGDHKKASWGNQIRNYVLHPYKMVKDLRTKVETTDTASVLDGNLEKFIQAEIRI
jgi:peptide chain release factor 2